MKILSAEQIKVCDAFTIKNEPIASIDLMERAATACIKHIVKNASIDSEFLIFCGKGNNGGDGLAIARFLIKRNYSVKVYVLNHAENGSEDFKINLERLKELKPEALFYIDKEEDLKPIEITSNTLVIDALFGTGLNKPLSGIVASLVNFINATKIFVISIDIPSGLYADKENVKDDVIVRSSVTLSFQFPKFSFFMPQNGIYFPEFEVLDIGLDKTFIHNIFTPHYYITKSDLQPLLKHRAKFSHKGNFGHALLVAGAYGKMGASVIAAKACLRSGAGMLTVQTPKKGIEILQSSIPEAMVNADSNEELISELPHMDKITAVGIGPGIGTEAVTESVIKKLLNYTLPMVFDADAINILANNKTWLSFLAPDTILTPHVKEFDRLTQKHINDFERLESAKQFAIKHRCILVLKSAYTQTVMPDGNVFFNSTGNAGLAKGGSGDTLTGIILGLLARGYTPPQAALIGVYIHGSAADSALKKIHIESLLATDVIAKLPKAFEKLYE
ncbi:MAG: NAD(P)H-hydrate dehydratase [Sphingobacteriaceae bacterium]|nr:NAD(P)H-hydrate dehydratase [Sphingobacteriaceae bacterium]